MYAIERWNDQRQQVFMDRYALKNESGEPMEIDHRQAWNRIAFGLGRDEDQIRRFEEVLTDFKFVPAGRVFSGVSAMGMKTLYNCFVIGLGTVETGRDTRAGIMHTVTRMVEITSRGGGVGINWSALRPNGARIRGVDGISSGAISWAGGADRMVDSIRQGGTRTAALMFSLADWHPDIEEFIKTSFLRANHSVLVSDEFIHAVREDLKWDLRFPDTTYYGYDRLWDGDLHKWEKMGLPVVHYKTVSARDLWDEMSNAVVRTGNPGCLFIDRANQLATVGGGELTSTNPCGEQWLTDNGSCNLGAINLVAHWDPKTRNLDHKELNRTIRRAVEMLDRVIDVSPPMDPQIDRKQLTDRRIGIGTMGLADLLILQGLRYGSTESLSYIDALYRKISESAYIASLALGHELGSAPGFTPEFFEGEFAQRLNLPVQVPELWREGSGMRNLALTSQAPTGTTSILAGVSSGIEPVFASRYIRRDATGEHEVIHPLFDTEDIGPQHVTAMDVTVGEHIMVQAAIQQWTDNSVSKTINMPRGTLPSEVREAYMTAFDLGLKGITVYVDGSREGVLDADCPTGVCDV